MKEEVVKSGVKFNNVDVHELGIYLRKNLSSEEIQQGGYEDLLPRNIKSKPKNKQNTIDNNDLYEYVEDIECLFDDDFEFEDGAIDANPDAMDSENKNIDDESIENSCAEAAYIVESPVMKDSIDDATSPTGEESKSKEDSNEKESAESSLINDEGASDEKRKSATETSKYVISNKE